MKVWYLENLNVLHLLCPKKLRTLEHTLDVRTFEKGTYISPGETSKEKFCFLTGGKIKVGSYDAAGHELTKAILTKGEIFGEIQARDIVQNDFIYTLSTATVYFLSIEQLRQLLRKRSGLYLFWMKIWGSDLLELEHRLPSLIAKDARARIVELIEELVIKRGRKTDDGWMIKNFVTETYIAKRTGTSRHTVSEILKEFQYSDIIRYHRCQLVIKKPDLLKQAKAVAL